MTRPVVPVLRGVPAPVAGAPGALAALRYLHEDRQLLHRDVKAANLLLTSRGEIKLAGGFGSPALVSDPSALASTTYEDFSGFLFKRNVN